MITMEGDRTFKAGFPKDWASWGTKKSTLVEITNKRTSQKKGIGHQEIMKNTVKVEDKPDKSFSPRARESYISGRSTWC